MMRSQAFPVSAALRVPAQTDVRTLQANAVDHNLPLSSGKSFAATVIDCHSASGWPALSLSRRAAPCARPATGTR